VENHGKLNEDGLMLAEIRTEDRSLSATEGACCTVCTRFEVAALHQLLRVLKPPGGGSSDIFGTSEALQQSPRRAHANHHLQSSMFGTNGTTETSMARRNKPGNDSYSRLFGPIESRPPSTPGNRMKSNIPFGGMEGGSDAQQSGNGTPAKSGTIQNGQLETSATTGGNPVTGEGFVASVANDEKGSPPPPAAITNNGMGSAEMRRNRVPPGGYSSGLW